jgi:Ca2+-binding EF-hand superfamily protein
MRSLVACLLVSAALSAAPIAGAGEPPPAPTAAPHLAEHFDRADTDGDGRLDEEEATTAGFFSRSSFGDADRDSDGHVTLFELGKSVQGSLQKWLSQHDEADTDRDGYVSKDESGTSLSTVFDRADRDGDGRLSRQELMDDVTHGYYSETATQPVVPNIIDERF